VKYLLPENGVSPIAVRSLGRILALSKKHLQPLVSLWRREVS
jgi:hypothetical protein